MPTIERERGAGTRAALAHEHREGPRYNRPAGDDEILAAFTAATEELQGHTATPDHDEDLTETGPHPTGTQGDAGATTGAAPDRGGATRRTSARPGIVRSTRGPKAPETGPDGTVEADSAEQHPGAQGTKGGSSNSTPNGYLISKEYASKAKLDYVDGVLGRVPDVTEAQRYFWLHVLLNGLIGRRALSGDMVPVASALMLEWLPDCPHTTEEMWAPLVAAGVLEVNADYSIIKSKTREFRVPAPIALGYVEAGADAKSKTGYELFSGKRTRSPKTAQKTLLKTDAGHYHPDLIDATLRHFQGVRREVNRTAVERHLEIRRERYEDGEAAWVAAGRPEGAAPTRKAYLEARGVYVNDTHCYETIQKQDWQFERTVSGPKPDGDEIWSYVPAYEVQELSGRLTEKMGGLQSASRPMKGASVVGIVGDPRTGYVNYDLKSSQLYALFQGFEEAGIDTAPVRDLLAQDKAAIADRIGVTVDTYKACLYALLFHAWITGDIDRALDQSPDGAIVKAILDDPTENKPGAYWRLYETMAPLKKGLKKWHRWLVRDYWEALPKTGPGYAVNDCGVTFRLGDYAEGHEQRSKMAAWYLQGKEACYVHHLTLLGPKYGYTVVANEHDGVLSDREILPKAIAEAIELANFTYAQLIEKPIGTPLWNDPTTSPTNDPTPSASSSTSSTLTARPTTSPSTSPTMRPTTSPTATLRGPRSARPGAATTFRTSSLRVPSAEADAG